MDNLSLSEAAKFLEKKGFQEADLLISALIEHNFLAFKGFVNDRIQEFYRIPSDATSVKCSISMNDVIIIGRRTDIYLPVSINDAAPPSDWTILCEHVTIRYADLCSLLAIELSVSAANDNPRGRKQKYNWSSFEIQLSNLLDHHGAPSLDDPDWSCQADVERAMADWCLKEWGQCPSESMIKGRVGGFLKDWNKADNS